MPIGLVTSFSWWVKRIANANGFAWLALALHGFDYCPLPIPSTHTKCQTRGSKPGLARCAAEFAGR